MIKIILPIFFIIAIIAIWILLYKLCKYKQNLITPNPMPLTQDPAQSTQDNAQSTRNNAQSMQKSAQSTQDNAQSTQQDNAQSMQKPAQNNISPTEKQNIHLPKNANNFLSYYENITIVNYRFAYEGDEYISGLFKDSNNSILDIFIYIPYYIDNNKPTDFIEYIDKHRTNIDMFVDEYTINEKKFYKIRASGNGANCFIISILQRAN